MQPVTGFAIYAIGLVVIWTAASRRGRRGWLFALGALLGGPVVVMLAGSTGASGETAATLAFAFLGVVLLSTFVVDSGDTIAERDGSYMGKRKCPHCAESIKAEARVCKHCGRDIASA